MIVGRCELPVSKGITFPLKAHYNEVNSDIFNPMLIEEDPEADEESDREMLQARAPPDLDARIPRDGMETPPITPHPSEQAEEVRGEDREDGLHRVEFHAPPIPGLKEREDSLPREATPPPPSDPSPVVREREDSLPREAISPPPSEPDGTIGTEKVTDKKWNVAFKWWCRHISSEEPKQVVVTLMNAPEVEGFTTRGVTVCSVPSGTEAKLITSRHHVPSQAEWRRTAVQLREEEDVWYWTEPIEHWASKPNANTPFSIDGFSIRYTITVFYDKNIIGDTPTYFHKTKVAEDRKWTSISLTDDGRLCKMDFGGRWRTVDESGTGLRAGTSRPPDMPSDAYEYLQRGKRKDPASSSAAPVMVGVEHGSHQPWTSTGHPPRIAIDIGGVISNTSRARTKLRKNGLKLVTQRCLEQCCQFVS